MDPASVIAALQQAVPDLLVIYQFGSTAAGQEHPESDLDLAVLAGSRLEPLARFRLQEDLARSVGRDVDLVDLTTASTVMRKEVIANGRVLYDADPAGRSRFEARVLAEYARLNEERRAIIEDARRRGSIHG